jgi:hypothetical protein
MKKYFIVILIAIFALISCRIDNSVNNEIVPQTILEAIQENKLYTSKDSVAVYIYLFHKLPSNYVNKAAAQELYEEKGNVFTKWNFNPLNVLGIMVGGDVYYNNEKKLPIISTNYYEADVDYFGDNRGTKRLVYTTDGTVFYTANHYETFVKLY